ncbi:MAG: hypothetical protein UR73_C0031G0003 [candidate division WS6 bacterium GW2011_GWF1_35_23]|uniref:Baseplate protein J-like domain-containing protein n=1 Tax=candidate division WS6 bacterium GW2011_GWF1_35_23 TaxID=1619097 RepID=A0A0G0EL43_9BACT|nr:MAG: hypothetical protein UR73_C0031G0003 [candidate division WS6 bacterium GW2011_GWF1_35_23]
MDETKKNTKLVIGREDELTDIVSGILEAPTERVILTFAEDSDLLISPINLSVLLETADDSEKTLVAQIIKNPTGLRNSSIAGLTTTDSPNNPTEDMWLEAEEKKVVRLSPKPKDKAVEKKAEELPESKESSFEKKINDAIQRSRDGIATKAVEKSVQKEGVFLSLDEDLPTGETEKVDDIEIKYEEFPQADIPTQPVVKKGFKLPKIDLQNLWPFKKGLGNTSGIKKYLPIGILSLVLVTILAFVIYLQTGPFVKVSVYVEAKEVSIEKIFTGDENIQAIDFENLKIPIKVESVEKDRSSTIKATGKAYSGEKAAGKVTLTGGPSCTVAISLPAGQLLLTSGKSFTLDSATTVPCPGVATDISLHAREIGAEYNIESNNWFVVQGHLQTEVFGYNPSAFTGGSKQEYTVLSKSDVDTGVATLTDEAELEAENELRDASGDWSIIEDSITSEVVKDSTKTSVAVGAAGSDVDLSIKVKSSATYYLTEGFDEGIATLLTNEAQEKNLFEGDDNLDLGLNENIEKTISVVEDSKKAVKIKLVAKGNVSPKVDKEKIVNTLKEMKWEEGLEYLQTLHFSEKRISASFFPKNILSKYPYFPKRHGGIIIEVHNI